MLWEKFQWILPLYMKPINFQSKASVVCSVTTAVFIDFCLKKLNVFPNIFFKKETNTWIPQNKSPGIEMLINFLCQLLPKILLDDAASTCCEKELMVGMSEHTGPISSLSLLLVQTQAARWKAATPDQLTGAHLYLDIA